MCFTWFGVLYMVQCVLHVSMCFTWFGVFYMVQYGFFILIFQTECVLPVSCMNQYIITY